MKIKPKASLQGADLRGADLYKTNLTNTNLRKANLIGVDLREADLRYANLHEANLQGTDLQEANLYGVDLQWTNLYLANLCGANLRKADLQGANLRRANLQGANLREANLQRADLRGANLQGANLQGADLHKATILETKGLINKEEFLVKFEKTEKGYIVFKSFNENYTVPSAWIIEPGSTITEEVDEDQRETCSYGINFGTSEWCKAKCKKQIWKCLLKFEDLDELIVPYATDGKARCARLTILGAVE